MNALQCEFHFFVELHPYKSSQERIEAEMKQNSSDSLVGKSLT